MGVDRANKKVAFVSVLAAEGSPLVVVVNVLEYSVVVSLLLGDDAVIVDGSAVLKMEDMMDSEALERVSDACSGMGRWTLLNADE